MKKATSAKRKTSARQFVLGRAAFAKISAVEGIQMSPAMASDFKKFDKQRLSAAKRRSALKEKYGKKQ